MPDYIPIESIITEPILVDEDQLKLIRESIAEQGCHHALLVQSILGGYNGDEAGDAYKLIAGKKRFLALQQLGVREVPVKILPSNLTDIQCREYALHENLRRANLPWYEICAMEKQLHDLRIEQNGQRKSGNPHGEKSGWSMTDTARELGIAKGSLSQDIDLALAVATNPSLKNIKDKMTALKLIKTEVRRNEAEAYSLIPPDFEMNQVFLGDSLDILKQIQANSFDACITDPPWSTYERDLSLTAEVNTLLPVFKEVFRVLKNDSFLYLICSSPDFDLYRKELPKLGFHVQDYPIIWQKTHTITHGRKNWEYARDYEPILVAVKGNPILTRSTEISSILKYKNLHYNQMIHPHEKCLPLIEQLVSDCTFTGGKILDPFSGSGVTLESAKKLGRYYIGIEKNQEFYSRIIKRLGGSNG